jgi:PEP-CTERM motif
MTPGSCAELDCSDFPNPTSKNMKRTPKSHFKLILVVTVAAVAFAASQGRTQGLDITWNADSTSAFDVTVSGTGQFDSSSGSYFFAGNPGISPSGLWQVGDGTAGIWPSSLYPDLWEIEGGGGVNFLPTHSDPFNPDLGFITYHDFKPNVLPVQDGNTAAFGELLSLGWSARETFAITSEPNPNDPSTWTFVERNLGSGPALAVPEPATWGLLTAGTLLCSIWLRRVKPC